MQLELLEDDTKHWIHSFDGGTSGTRFRPHGTHFNKDQGVNS